MATGAEILSYQGSGGLGSNADIPVSPAKDLDVVNQSIRDVALRSAQKNMMLYQEKVKQRDKMFEMLANDEIKVGDHLERDNARVKSAMEDMDVAFHDWMKEPNNLDKAHNYQKVKRNANDVALQANARKLYFDKESADSKNDRIPSIAEKRNQHLESVLSNFDGDLTPFQPFNTFNPDLINGLARSQTIELPDDVKKPYQKGKRTFVDYGDTLQRAGQQFLNPDASYNQRLLHDTLLEMPTPEFADTIKGVNAKLTEHNKKRGIVDPSDPSYAKPIIPIRDKQTGKWNFTESLPELAAKFSLAQQANFQQDAFDIDKGKLDIYKAQEDVRHNKAMEAIGWGRIGVDKDKLNKASADDLTGADSVIRTLSNIITKGEEANKPNLFSRIIGSNKKQDTFVIADPTLLQQFGKIDKDGKQFDIPDVVEYNKKNGQLNLLYYKSKNGVPVLKDGQPEMDDTKQKSLDERTWIAETTKQFFPNKDIGSINSLINDALESNNNSLYDLSQRYTKGGGKSQIKEPKKNKSGKYPLPKGQSPTVEQNGYTYSWDEETGQYQ